MKTCKLLVAACGCVLAAQAVEIPSAALAADPRYRARHYEIDIPEGEYWWGGEVLEGLKQPFSRTSAKYAVDMRRRHDAEPLDEGLHDMADANGADPEHEQRLRLLLESPDVLRLDYGGALAWFERTDCDAPVL